MTSPSSPPAAALRRTLLTGALAGLLGLTGLLTGCSAAEDAVQGAQDKASQQASQAVDGAKDQASAKASQVAVDAVRAQVCTLVEDGSLSDADARALDGLVDTGERVGVSPEVLTLARSLATEGGDASRQQVSDLRAEVCTQG